ncbi:AfsR/SARP family transcriptional regulator [Stackebrandtia nassauensis]|uniref:AfsR/SARP family transcriptional regulator n=1 Tax=Stackebrandtia nassauensis TaxID=283811 RepID=UPI0001A399C3|nr:AfsR/SARP family transcriptional regulator [Stackebrandtia nassauensis]
MKFRILGPLEVSRDGEPVTISGRHHPKLLALLLLETGRVVTVSRLVDALWENDPPATARRQIQNTMASLRRQLAGDDSPTLEATGEGYRLLVPAKTVDAQCFTDLVRQARTARDTNDLPTASRLFAEALALWRGEALAGLSGRVVEAAVVRLNESRLSAIEDRCDIDIALGRHGQVVGELRELLEHHPYRQRVAGLLMTALHHSGRTPEALEVFTEVRARLSDELGLDPDPDLNRLHGEILRGDLDTPTTEPTPPSAPRPAQLPADTATFTGREEQLAALDNLLADGRTATVVSAIAGMGGAGKTALAVHWAHHVRDRFPDGQLYINLRGYDEAAPVSPADALTRFLNALGQPGAAIPTDPDEAGAMYRSLLADQRMLILLDNARDAAQVRPLLPGGGGNFALITSRDRLTSLVALDDVAPLRIDTLSHEESVDLLSNLVDPVRLHSEPEATHQLARLCGHLPLALRIAGANLADRPETNVTQFVAELEGPQRLQKLTAPDDPAVAITRTLHLSVSALTPAARQLFTLLGILPGEDFSHDLAAHLAGTVTDDAPRAINELEAAHLVESHHDNRLRFHDLVREYANARASQWDDADRGEAVTRVIGWYDHNKATLPTDERDNVLRMLSAWNHRPDSWRLAAVLGRFVHYGPDLPRQLELLRHELSKAEHNQDHPGRCQMNSTLAIVHREMGHRTTAIEYAREAVQIMRDHDVDDPVGKYVGNLGLYLGDMGRVAEAVPLVLESYNAAVATGDDLFATIRASTLGTLYAELGDYGEGEKWTTMALKLTEQPSLRFFRQGISYCLCEQYVSSRRFSDAEPLITDILNQPDSSGAKYHALTLILRAEINRARGRYDAAHEDLAEALRHASQTDRSGLRDMAECGMAELEIQTGHPRQAIDRLMSSHPANTDQMGALQRAQADRLLCLAHARLGDGDTAINYGDAALAAFRSMPRPLLEARTLVALAEAHDTGGDKLSAQRDRESALEIFTRLGIPVEESREVPLGHGQRPPHWDT